jgi:hypothetical protein
MAEEQTMKSKEKKIEHKDSTIYQTNENCQVFNGPISGCVFAMPGATVNQSPVQQVSPTMDEDKSEESEDDSEHDEPEVESNVDLVEKLKPLFYNNENDVRLFLKEISGMQPNNITDLVNTWVQDKRISDYGSSRKGNLWKILHDAKLYPRTIQNWNRRVY